MGGTIGDASDGWDRAMQAREWRFEDWKPAMKIMRFNGLLSKGLLPPFVLRLSFSILRHRAMRTCGRPARSDVLNSLNYAAMIGHARWDGRINRMRRKIRHALIRE